MKTAYVVILLVIIFWPNYSKYVRQGYNKYTVKLGDQIVGVTDSVDDIYYCYSQARKQLASEHGNDLYMVQYLPLSYEGEEVVFGKEDDPRIIISNMKAVLDSARVYNYEQSYAIKVGDSLINVDTAHEAKDIFQSVIDKYTGGDGFEVTIDGNDSRELSVMTVSIKRTDGFVSDNEDNSGLIEAGAEENFEVSDYEEDKSVEGFESFDYGVTDIAFSQDIEIAEAYVPSDRIMPYEEAKNFFTETKDVQEIYKVESGDTLSEISMKVNLPMDEIIAMNNSLEDTNSLIVPGQELIITSPQPSLSVLWSYQARVKEVYDLPTEYVYNDNWYTNQTVTLQQPSSGSHDAVLLITNENLKTTGTEVLYEEILNDPVAKIVEKGTIVPPTYIKPIAGGRQTSGFGRRNRPTKGASSYHKGIDWATPVGTSVVASCGGTVAFAGWGSGYGNVIYINHPDGRQTRYGHLSRIFVSTGQTVTQGQKIAASGNTGVSTGPHLHFEILINGSQVNPLNHLN